MELRSASRQAPYDNQNSLAAKLGSGKPCVLAFLAPDCGLCRSLAPELLQMEADGSVCVARLDSSQSQAWAPELLTLNVERVPCFVLAGANGQAICKTGAPNGRQQMAAGLQAMVEHAAQLNASHRD